MKPDLTRILLQRIRELPLGGQPPDIHVEGYSEDEITRRVMQLHEVGYIEAVNYSHMLGTCWRPTRLTHSGEQYLAALGRNTVWAKMRRFVLVPVVLGAVVAVARAELTAAFSFALDWLTSWLR